jgi:hypothetical protein
MSGQPGDYLVFCRSLLYSESAFVRIAGTIATIGQTSYKRSVTSMFGFFMRSDANRIFTATAINLPCAPQIHTGRWSGREVPASGNR